MPGFTPVEAIHLSKRPTVAMQLSSAARNTPGLSRELPLPAEGYKDPIHAFRRIGKVASKIEDKKLRANLICGIADSNRAVGMTTTELGQPRPTILPDKAIEFSYWHRQVIVEGMAHEIGTTTLKHMARISLKFYADQGIDEYSQMWTVTLPDDQVKYEVFAEAGLAISDEPRRYDIHDDVTEPRHLWTAPIGLILS